ncbi:MAG: cytidylate kinase family protein [Magnetococcales bacterium]|nr:cytidylate kinase family protein [Magnetococcales bacterium]
MENSSGIGSMIKSGLFVAHQQTPERASQPSVVTVSRNFGSNGGKIAELLAQRLQVPCYGHSMIDELASKTRTTKKLMDLMDEKLPRPIDSFIYSLFVRPDQSVDAYYRNIIKTVHAISKRGGVIVGRGARLILSEYPQVFRLHVEGSREVCVKRVAMREGIGRDAAKLKIAEIEKERSRFLKGLYKRHPNNRTYYDLVLNSDNLDPRHAVEIILNAMEKMGYLPEAHNAVHPQPLPVILPPPGELQVNTGLDFLIVEDEPEFFAIVNGWLANSMSGKESAPLLPLLNLTHATTFKEAEAFLERHKFDLILLDLNLSDSRGYDETFVRINQKHLDTPIIVFTGLDDDQKAAQAVDEGAQDYLVKGQVSKKTLLRSIKHALSRYQIMRTYTRS